MLDGLENDTMIKQFHIYTDASTAAYAAVAYARGEGENGNICVRLSLSKTRVAPLGASLYEDSIGTQIRNPDWLTYCEVPY